MRGAAQPEPQESAVGEGQVGGAGGGSRPPSGVLGGLKPPLGVVAAAGVKGKVAPSGSTAPAARGHIALFRLVPMVLGGRGLSSSVAGG